MGSCEASDLSKFEVLKMQHRNGKGKSTWFTRNEQKASSNFRSTPSDAMRHSHIDFALLIYTSILNVMLYNQIDQEREEELVKIYQMTENELHTLSFCLPENPTAI